MIDFTWMPGVPSWQQDANFGLSHGMDIFVLHEASVDHTGFFGDGWATTDKGARLCRWYWKVQERRTLFSLRRSLRLDPSRMSAERLLLAWRKAQAWRDAFWKERGSPLVEALEQTKTAFYLWPEEDGSPKYVRKFLPTRDRGYSVGQIGYEEDFESVPLKDYLACRTPEELALGGALHRFDIRHGQLQSTTDFIGYCLLAIVSAQLPKVERGETPPPRAVRIADETWWAEVRETHEMNLHDRIHAWRLTQNPNLVPQLIS